MSGAVGQAAGLAVGAAVGFVIGGPGGAALGASIVGGGVGYYQQTDASKTQYRLDTAALELNQEQARLRSAETSAQHATEFRKALASQIAVASMRGGTGSVVAQFGFESFGGFLRDQEAIKRGLLISETQAGFGRAQALASREARDLSAASTYAKNVTDAVNLNILKKKA